MPSGSKPGERRGGRPKGTPNKFNAARAAQAAAMGMLPHEFLLYVTRGGEIVKLGGKPGELEYPTLDQRIDAAKAAAPYYAPRLATVEVSGPGGGPIEHREVSDAQRARAMAAFFAKVRAEAIEAPGG